MRCIRDLKFFLAAGIFVMSGIAISADAVEKKASPSVKISFPYIRQSGIAGNQFAVWVENANGQFIKTLYVTSYTGKGGYAVRKDCVPTWVRRSGAANTPKNGTGCRLRRHTGLGNTHLYLGLQGKRRENHRPREI